MTFSFKIRLTNKQLEALSGISADIGQAVFASTLLPFAFQLGKIEIRVVVLGLINAVFFWIASIYLAKERE